MLEWNVYVEDFNARKFKAHNVFTNRRFVDACKKAYTEHKSDRTAFEEDVRKALRYDYWSRCEWEIILSSWPPSDRVKEEKIDVYDQVMLNWKVFIDYILNNIKNL